MSAHVQSSGSAPPAATATTEIAPPRRWAVPSLSELWRSADLIYFLAKRDVAVRYKQTAIGAVWAVLQPLLLAGVFAVFLGQLTDIPSGGVPYALFALAGMTIWLFISTATARCSESTVASADLISKVYFPRITIPLSAIAAPVLDFVASFVVLLVILVAVGEAPDARVLLAPPVFAVAVAITLGIGLWLSALIVRYRDVRVLIPFGTQVMLFLTPILYPLSLVPEDYRQLYALNPLVGVLEAFRWTLFPEGSLPGWPLVISTATGLLLTLSGLFYFARAEQRFADVI